MSEDIAFNYEDLYYIALIGDGNKNPAREWGGYSQNFEEADNIYRHDEVEMVPGKEWGVVDIEDIDHGTLSLLIFDLDVHKAGEDFDPADITLPSNAPVVKSQNGGFHVYFAVHADRGEGAESDFKMTADLDWDIDIRGSYVSHHVVAPADIPGVNGDYELVDDTTIPAVIDPADAAERIQYKGEPLLEHDRDTGISADFEFDRPSEPPEDMPACYHAGLELRKANPDDHPNTHKVNVLTAQCGLAAGYDVDAVVQHFVDDYAPGPNVDVGETEYQVKHLARGRYSPPAISTLREYGILEEDEECECEISYHGAGDDGTGFTDEQYWDWWSNARKDGQLSETSVIPERALVHIAREQSTYDMEALEEVTDEIEKLPPAAHNKALYWVKEIWPEEDLDLEDGEGVTDRDYRSRDPDPVFTWEDVRYIYEESKDSGRQAAENLLRSQYNFMTVIETDSLHVYDPEKGIYTTKLSEVKGEIHEGLCDHWSTHELNEIEARLRQQNRVEPRHLNARYQFDDPHICVKNGVLNLFTRERLDHSPDYYFTDRVPVKYDEDADTEPFEWFIDDVTSREEDALAMMEMVGHALVPDANERYKKFLILHGGADNGKSVFFSRVVDLLEGPESEENNISNVKLEKITSNRFSTNSVYGNMANIAGEINGKKIRNTAHIKDITGGDQVEIEPKGGDSFFDIINSTLMFAANDPPIMGERDKEAIATRIVPVKLPYTYTSNPTAPLEKEKIPEKELEEKLATPEALSGFLNLALDGIERLEENDGDVSLPESESERLEKYEKQADPMKEFGHECLKNMDGDYVVKADVTSIYKEFASVNGYEIGTNIHDTLHGVLQGMKTLNYTTSKPRSPDYTATSLPLRGWGDRKNVIDRVSLTEQGIEYAREAGLVDGDAEREEQEDDQTVMHSPIATLDVGRKDFTATVAAVSDGEYNREAQGTLKGPHGTYIDFVVPGGNANPLEENQGETFRFENVRVRTDEDGLLEAVVNDATMVTETDPGQQTGLEKNEEREAATDGGGELEGTKGTVHRHVAKERKSGETVTAAEIAGQLEIDPNKVANALARLEQQGIVTSHPDGYEVM